MMLLAGLLAVAAGDIDWFLIGLIAGIPILWLVDRRLFAHRRDIEKRASRRFLGLPDE